jgi:gliding motility-associated-like protein
VICFGGSTGSATVTATGGVSPYTYAWAPSGGTGSTATGLTAATYTATVTDANGCTTTATTTVTQPTAVTASASSSPVLCNGGSTGSATVTSAGGIGPYTYAWAPTGGTAATATGLTAQAYTVTVTDANGCSITATTTVTQPTALAATTSFTQATCNMSNGSASVSVSGGVGPYTYSWAPSGGTAASATGLAANTYTVTYTDANGCTGTATATVPNAAAPTATITATVNVSCFGGNNGSLTVSASGGTSPYTYAWAPTGGTATTASGLTAQSYTVTVTDVNGCTTTASATVTQPPVLTASASSSPVICFGGSTGSATVTATGGVSPYTYAWAPSGGTGSTATGLTAATYTATVTDANGCTTTATTTVTQPTAVTASASSSPVLCNGGSTGSATVTPAGGIGPYTYAWAPTGGTAATATGLTAQAYTVTVTDANGCSITATTTVTQPTALAATTSFTQSTCSAANGSASVSVSGGIGPYTYSWAPTGGTAATATGLTAQTYTVTYTDANSCSGTATVNVTNAGSPTITITATTDILCFGGNNGAATTTTTGGTAPYVYAWSPIGGSGANGVNMTAQSYTVTVTDANGCSATATCTITEPPLLTSSAVMTPVLCNGGTTGTATATGAGGVTPYGYAWNPSAQITQTATGLSAQTYSCVITDANGCSSTATVTVTEPPVLTSTISGVDVLCNGGNNGSATVTPIGGTGPYTYNWTPGSQVTQTATTLIAGNYSCDITDANGCSITLTIAITEPPALSAVTSFTQSTCGASNGIADVVCSGGVGPYTYSWSPLGGTGSTTTGVPTGNYTCTITDANSCSITATVNVPTAPGPSATIAPPTMVSCFGGSDGEAIVTPNGGTSPYSYAWSNNDLDSIAGNLIAGNYSVTVTDANGCTATATVLIVEPGLLTVQASAAPSTVCVGAQVSLSASAGGGTPGYQFDWTPGPLSGPNQTVIPTATTTYTLTVTDANGCTTTQPVLVTVNPLPSPTFVGDVLAGCAPLCVNFSDLSTVASGSVTGWSWDFGDGNVSTQQNPSNCYTDAGVYSVTLTVTSAAGCTQTIVMNSYINVFANPVANFGASPQPTTILDPEICFTDSSTLAAQWDWNFGDLLNSSSTVQNPCFTYQDPTCYLVTLNVTSADGCTDSDTQTVCITPDVSIYVPNTFTPNGNGLNDLFYPVTIGIDPTQYEMWIFDRWGNMIWYTDDLDDAWDGIVLGHTEVVQQDTYVWKIKCKDVMGNQHNLIGHVNVIK